MPEGVGPIVYSEAQIQRRVAGLARAIDADHPGRELVVIGVLTGTVIFVADLLRALSVPTVVDFLAISRFGPSRETHGAVRLIKDLETRITGRSVLLVENFVDTGFTLHYLLNTLRARQPESLRVCALLDRPQRRLIDVSLDYVGFEPSDDFLIGYGLHYRQQYRQLPYIAKLDVEELNHHAF